MSDQTEYPTILDLRWEKQRAGLQTEANRRPSPISGLYVLHSLLGSGADGHVFAAVCRPAFRRNSKRELDNLVYEVRSHTLESYPTENVFAVKIALRKGRPSTLHREFLVLKELHESQDSTENIVQAFAYGNMDEFDYLFLEFCQMNLGKLIRHEDDVSRLSEEEFLDLVEGIAAALAVIHAKNYGHFDVKPENILVQTREGKRIFKLADFGHASRLPDSGKFDANHTTRGTLFYHSPEQFRTHLRRSKLRDAANYRIVSRTISQIGDLEYDVRSDIWSFGLVILHSLAGVASISRLVSREKCYGSGVVRLFENQKGRKKGRDRRMM